MSAAALLLALGLLGAEASPTEPAVTYPELIGELPATGALRGRRDVARVVRVRFTVGVDGAVTDASAVLGPGEPWDSAAVDMISRATFRPATRGGQAIPVTLTTELTVGRWPGAWASDGRRGPEEVERVAQGIAGRVLEKGSRRPLAGIPVLLEGEDLSVVTDEAGRFGFRNLAKGRYRLTIPGYDHQSLTRRVRAPADLTLRLTPNPSQRYRTVVRAPSTADAARVLIPVERAREVPGSAGDPLKVIESLPGVARPAAAGPNVGQLSVRGSAPEDTKLYVDGMPLFQLYHFGNVYSVLQDEWIKDVDFRAGGVSVEYGDATGGLLGVTLADIPSDAVHGHLDVNVYHAAALVTAPVSDTWSVGLAFRRSYFDAILNAIFDQDSSLQFSAAPRYYDYQARADWRPNDRTSLRLLAFGSDDLLAAAVDTPSSGDPNGRGFRLRRFFHQVQGRLTTQLSRDLTFDAGLATSYQRLEIRPGGNDFTLTFDPVTLRTDLDYRASPALRLRGGLLATAQRYETAVNLPRPTKEGQVALPAQVKETIETSEGGVAGQLALWTEASWRAAPSLLLIGGLRLTGWIGIFDEVATDARLTGLWDLAEATRLRWSVGVNHQAPPADEWSESLGNPDLAPERAWSLDLGVTQRLLDDRLSIELQGFYKALDNLVSDTEVGAPVPYDNAGTGTIYGGELLVRASLPPFDGWLAYTLSRSRRTDRPGEPDRPFSYDQTHVLAVVAGVDLGAHWRVGARFRYSTGNPYTPLTAAYYDAGADVWAPRPRGALLSSRLEPFLQLDLRVDKTWYFDDWRLNAYLELNNATNRSNIEQLSYSDDYSERQDITSLPITPSLGLRGSF